MALNFTLSRFLLFVFLLLFSLDGLCAPPTWLWGARGGSRGTGTGAFANERVTDLAADGAGNVYVLAVNNPGSPSEVGGGTGIGPFDRVTLASWDCSGRFRWSRDFGSGDGAAARAVGVDAQGGVYVIGYLYSISGSLSPGYVDRDTVLPVGNKTAFLVKYDSSGRFQWLRRPQPDTVSLASGSTSMLIDMDVEPDGTQHVFSYLLPGNYEGTSYLVQEGGFHVLRYDAQGHLLGGHPVDIRVSEQASRPDLTNVATARFRRDPSSGRYYIYGAYNKTYGSLSLGGHPIVAASGNAGIYPMYLGCFDASGRLLWHRQSSSDGYVLSRWCGPVFDGLGNVYIGGDAKPGLGNAFNGHIFTNAGSDGMCPFVISLDVGGDNRWASSSSTSGATTGSALAYRNGVLYLAGAYPGSLDWGPFHVRTDAGAVGGYWPYVAAFSAHAGTILSLDTLVASRQPTEPTAAVADANGNLFVGGMFAGRLYAGPNVLDKVGGTYDWFVAKLGRPACGCSVPDASFSYTVPSAMTFAFSYTGQSPYSSLSWDFGDGSPLSSLPSPVHAYASPGTYYACAIAENGCGPNMGCRRLDVGDIGIAAPGSALPSFRAWPVPADDRAWADGAPAGSMLELRDLQGRALLSSRMPASGPARLSLAGLAPGLYVLRATAPDGSRAEIKVLRR